MLFMDRKTKNEVAPIHVGERILEEKTRYTSRQLLRIVKIDERGVTLENESTGEVVKLPHKFFILREWLPIVDSTGEPPEEVFEWVRKVSKDQFLRANNLR